MQEAAEPIESDAARTTGFTGLRWVIISLVFFATLINYIDRLTVSVLAPVIVADLGLNNTEYGGIATWFLLAYTLSQGVSGKLYDRVGIKRGFSISIVVWSLAAMSHALATGLKSLSAMRFVLGLGEAGNWPGAAKTAAEWFPPKQRALAMGIFNSGAAIGSIVAPPIIVGLTAYFGHWQPTFLITGTLGFIWLALWWFVYDKPERHRWITPEELALIRGDKGATAATSADESIPLPANNAGRGPLPSAVPAGPSTDSRKYTWRELLRYRQTWGIVVSRFLVDPVWWLYITWLPLYLNKVHGFDLKQIGLFAWVPFVAADAGSLLGGWLSGFLISRGWSVDRARKTVIAVSALLMPAGIAAAFTPDAMLALAFIAVVLFGFQAWINNVQTLPSDFFPTAAVGSVAGLGGTGAGIGSMIFTFSTGWIVDNFSYTPVLVAAGILAPLGTIALFLLAGRIERVDVSGLEGGSGA